jgi:glycogen debranching enzyme
VYGDRAHARRMLASLRDALDAYAIGTLGEIFEGDPPHLPVGAIAQAWSVAEFVRAYTATAG